MIDVMLFFNFFDVIKEGDGVGVMRQYKYFFFYCRVDELRSIKYVLEILYQFLVYVLLLNRDRERFIWNRFVSNYGVKGGNIFFDEDMEYSNNFVK